MNGAGTETIFAAIAQTGLAPRGALHLHERERAGLLAEVRMVVLIGMAGRRGWEAFTASSEARDGLADPLDRFSRRVIGGLADTLGAFALYPFGGPPYWPFQRWAQRAAPVHPSPTGLLIDPVHGLWHSYRGALGFAGAPLDLPPVEAALSPCVSCRERPCLNACPVGAFSSESYDVEACAAYLRTDAGADCMARGCIARRACPVGRPHMHAPDQASFTMRAFLRARPSA
jgi:ferredoxin